MKRTISRGSAVATALLLALLASCSTEKILAEREYYDQATEAMKQKSYDLAIQDFQKLLEQYPFSDYSEEAQLRLGQAQYENKQYAEAIASFQDFQRMHPTNPNLALTEYYTALSYMDQMGADDRDQRAARNAAAHFRTVIDRYPDNPLAVEARKKLQVCREELAGHEYAIAKFYLIWTNPVGAEARLRRLLENYPDTETAADALMRFGKYFRKRGDLTRSALAFASVVSQYPKSPYRADAQEELGKLRAKKVALPDAPLPALVETLGRPSIAQASKPAAPSSATDVSEAQTKPDLSARN